ncbi:MAG TPA: response regulator [Bryobacteraceae bacterium]|jgi:DNA-binding NtrC family response regulator|nr:response regulator [Bryobacteraceae bacterium]
MFMASNPVPEPKTILVVDDDLSVLGVIKCMLECGDYSVLMAHSAETALRMAERNDLTIDLMLIDVIMPDISGPDLAEKILAMRPHLKVLFMSGCTDSEVVRVKILDRALGFLPKPFTSDGLLERVQKVLEPIVHRSVAGVGAPWH